MIKKLTLLIAVLLLPIAVIATLDFQDIDSITFPSANKEDTITTTFTVINAGDESLTNVVIKDNIDSKYDIDYNVTNLGTLDVDEEKSVEVTATIPTDQAPGVNSIGTITITSDDHNESFTLKMDVGNKLIIDKIEIIIDNQADTLNNDDETSDDTAEPGDTIKLNVKVSNLFDDDIEIEDIKITAILFEIDQDDEDLEEDSDEFDLESDRSKTMLLEFKLPLQVEEKSYSIEIFVEGQSEEGGHSDTWIIHFKLDKRPHDIILKRAFLSDETIDCGDSTTLTVEMLNIGTNYEDDVALEAKNTDIGLEFKQPNIELDKEPWEDDSYTRRIDIKVPSDTPAGNYPIIVKAFFERDNLDDYKTVNLAVDCEVAAEPEEQQEEESEEQQEEEIELETEPEETNDIQINQTEIDIDKIMESIESPLIQNKNTFILVLVSNVIVLGLLIFVGIRLYMKVSKKHN